VSGALTIPFARITDPVVRRIAERVATGERLAQADGVALFESADLTGIGALADAVNRAKHGDVVTFASNQHINPTNICTLRTTCVFCGYARLPKEAGAYRYTLEQVMAEARSGNNGMTREFHIVGGLDMQAGLEYYTTMFRALKAELPNVHIKALTAVEIAHIARIEKKSWAEVLTALKAAGLDTMPGGGAETFSAAVREEIARKKLGAADYVGVHRTAHALGIRTNCTMLYGHVETYADRMEHLQMLRDLQDETGGFLAYIPLAYHPDDNELGKKLKRQGIATSGVDDLKNLAIGRLFLDNIAHIKSHWIMVTPFLSQIALHYGVNDLEGTVVREKIYHAVGAQTTQAMSLDDLLKLIRGAGKVPKERDSFYRVVRAFEGTEDGGRMDASAEDSIRHPSSVSAA
jgi:aminodeoxyfutalosine synthase